MLKNKQTKKPSKNNPVELDKGSARSTQTCISASTVQLPPRRREKKRGLDFQGLPSPDSTNTDASTPPCPGSPQGTK
jgi:hypothetical protein